VTDLVEWLETAISAAEAEADDSHTVTCGWSQGDVGGSCDCDVPANLLRRCQADRKILDYWLDVTRDPYEGATDDQLHERRAHPAYEYATTEGPRKAWDYADVPPEGEGWEPNATESNPEAWERFDYTEESHWRRLRPEGPAVWTRPQPPIYIRLLAEGYGYQEAADHG
jgi:hypothetical protein